ncbi:uncharacterized protein LOC144434177 [Glandiceps talaboti]
MAIIPVKVKTKNSDRSIATYAFLDTGSAVSFCTESLMRRLCKSGKRVKITLDTMGKPFTTDTYIVEGLEVCDLQCKNTVELPKIYSKDKIPVSQHNIPAQKDIMEWPHLQEVDLPQIDAEVGQLIGNNVANAYTPLQTLTGPSNSPHATRTRLGRIVWNVVRGINSHGTTQPQRQENLPVNKVEVIAVEEIEELKRLDHMVRGAINLDFPECTIDDKRERSQEDKQFTKMVKETTNFIDGHYQIGLPFRNKDMKLPNNEGQAIQRLMGLERGMRRNRKFHEDYKTFMTDIISKGYAVKVPEKDMDRRDGKGMVYSTPWSISSKEARQDSSGIRLLSKVSRHISQRHITARARPNEHLLGVLLRFRQETVAMMADIEAMFHQMETWTKEPEIYRMMAHLFGGVSSPSCANTALHRTAEDNRGKFREEVTNTVLKDFYVDDCLKSVSTEDGAITLAKDMMELCKSGGFHLTKRVSNSCQVLETIPAEERGKEL